MGKRYGQACPVAKSLEVVGERWTLLVIRDLLGGARRFQDLRQSLRGIAPNILSERLKVMERHGLIARRLYSDHPPRAEYGLTDRGRELGLVVGALAHWGSRHVHRRSTLVHDDGGHEVRMVYYCAECHRRVPGATVRVGRATARRRRQRGAAARRSLTVRKR